MGTFAEGLQASPLWVQIWVMWLMVVNTAAILFLGHREGKMIFVVWMLNGASMMIAAEINGYNRLLGLVHIVWWTPLLIVLIRSRQHIEASTLYGRWFYVLTGSIAVSLLIDYIDVVRYALGDRS